MNRHKRETHRARQRQVRGSEESLQASTDLDMHNSVVGELFTLSLCCVNKDTLKQGQSQQLLTRTSHRDVRRQRELNRDGQEERRRG